jgi:hypothetical protein
MLVAWSAGALNHKDIAATDVIFDIDIQLTIAERHHLESCEWEAKRFAYCPAESWIGAP